MLFFVLKTLNAYLLPIFFFFVNGIIVELILIDFEDVWSEAIFH